jgi:hypothetical protein
MMNLICQRRGGGGDFEVPIIRSQQYRMMLGFRNCILIIVKFGEG